MPLAYEFHAGALARRAARHHATTTGEGSWARSLQGHLGRWRMLLGGRRRCVAALRHASVSRLAHMDQKSASLQAVGRPPTCTRRPTVGRSGHLKDNFACFPENPCRLRRIIFVTMFLSFFLLLILLIPPPCSPTSPICSTTNTQHACLQGLTPCNDVKI
eukprot:354507-Chlamydomonas_euryale.AAC.7